MKIFQNESFPSYSILSADICAVCYPCYLRIRKHSVTYGLSLLNVIPQILGHVNVHLRVMQAQMTSCHKDIRERLKEEFTSEIEEWLSSCMESEGEVMAQIKVQLLRALNGEMPEQVKPPATLHQYTESTVSEDEQSPTPSIFGGLFAMIMRGFERIDAIDANFREHPEKSSKRPRLRDRYR